MNKWLPVFMLTVCAAVPVWSQPGRLKLTEVVDVPTADSMAPADMHINLRMYPKGGFLTSVLVGLSERFAIGVSYGGENIIGTGEPNLNPQPCAHIRYQLFREEFLFPAICIGFNSQGYGGFNKKLDRYDVKSRGFYAVATKNTSFLGGLGLHGGISYSTETDDGDKTPDIFVACHKQLNQQLVILAEYDVAWNDNSGDALGSGKGYLNCGIRWSFADQIFVEFDWKDILENRGSGRGNSREVKIMYTTFL